MKEDKIVFNLIDGFYIRKLDNRNWILARKEIAKKGNKEKKEVNYGYHRDIIRAWNGALIMLPLLATSKVELRSIIERLEKIKLK